ncbi:MAG: WXG100 family type VII secretion target [Lachnospiraceae bacterium]|nr:WXG100 family type VII secretion target [Lachnospiraceae bacterium]
MADTRMTLDTDQVLMIATRIENDNTALKDLLVKSKATIDNLSAVWTGGAADATRGAYDSFSNRFFQQYHDILKQYVTFLRNNVATDYEQTEQGNIKLADSFK